MSQSVDIKVGFTCNNNCLHCVVANKRQYQDLAFNEIIQEIDSFINKYKRISIVLTGGEFTIRPDVLQIIEALELRKQQGEIDKIQLQTNGCALANLALAKRLSEIVDGFLIAIHAPDPELHDAITRTPGSFLQTVQGIQNVQDCIKNGARCGLITQTVISQFNYPTLPELFAILRQGLKINNARLTFPHPNGNAYSPAVVPQYAEIAPFVNDVLSFALQAEMRIGTEHIPLCVLNASLQKAYMNVILQKKAYSVGYDRSSRNTDGRIDYAETLPAEYRKWPTCKRCVYNDRCVGVWKEYMEFYAAYPLTPVLTACS